ncbi:MAG: acyltransferase 3 [Bacteroidetes bacterium]|nr:acyltransferase 3 [Bacteroidota bacterium]
MTKRENNIEWLDSLRALAIIGVLFIHISSPVVKMSFGGNMLYWWIGNIVNSTIRFAVPVFLMISGVTMLNREYKLGEFYKKRITRVLIPLLFWMVVYWIFRWFTLSPSIQPHDFRSIISWGVNLFLTEGISKHFWYVYMILFIYLAVPFLGMFVRKLSSWSLLFLLAAWVLLCGVSSDFSLNMYGWSGDYLSKFFGYFLYSGYLVLGYYIGKYTIVSRNIRLTALLVFIGTIAVSTFFAFYASTKAGRLDTTVYGYLNLNTIIQSGAIFLSLKNTNIRNSIVLRMQKTVSDYSFGIYLVHILVIGIFFQNGIFWTMAHPLVSLPVLVVLTLLTSMSVIFILRKIPLGKYISG